MCAAVNSRTHRCFEKQPLDTAAFKSDQISDGVFRNKDSACYKFTNVTQVRTVRQHISYICMTDVLQLVVQLYNWKITQLSPSATVAKVRTLWVLF